MYGDVLNFASRTTLIISDTKRLAGIWALLKVGLGKAPRGISAMNKQHPDFGWKTTVFIQTAFQNAVNTLTNETVHKLFVTFIGNKKNAS